jgi:DNA (cytosine-5)-methyltransferase 1
MNFKVVDLFAGIGGFTLGFHKEGSFETVFSNDVDSDMVETYKLNFPDVPTQCSNITKVNFDKILSLNKTIDVIVGGPPCQAYSTSGKRMLSDPRGRLFVEYGKAISKLNPKLFIYENVKGLLSINKGKLIKEIIEMFSDLGYKIDIEILNAGNYGVPQERKRVILVGTSKGINFSYPEKINKLESEFSTLPSALTLNDALSDLPLQTGANSTYKFNATNDYQSYLRKDSEILTEHVTANHNDNLMKIIKALPEGGTVKDIPISIRPNSGYGNSYARLWWDKPSTTITRNLGTPSSARCVHPIADRALSTREGARLQSFPDSFQFHGSRSKKNLQIGNAIPPLLAFNLAKSVKNSLS